MPPPPATSMPPPPAASATLAPFGSHGAAQYGPPPAAMTASRLPDPVTTAQPRATDRRGNSRIDPAHMPRPTRNPTPVIFETRNNDKRTQEKRREGKQCG